MSFPIRSVSASALTPVERNLSENHQSPSLVHPTSQPTVSDTFILAEAAGKAPNGLGNEQNEQLKQELNGALTDFKSRMNTSRTVEDQKDAVVRANANLARIQNKLPQWAQQNLSSSEVPLAQSNQSIQKQVQNVILRIDYIQSKILNYKE